MSNQSIVEAVYEPKPYQPKTIYDHIFRILGLTNRELSLLLGIHPTQISMYATGRLVPSVKVAKRLQTIVRERGMEVTLDELFADVKEKEVDDDKYAYLIEIKNESKRGEQSNG